MLTFIKLLGLLYRLTLRLVIYLATWSDAEKATHWAIASLEWIERHPTCLRLLDWLGKSNDPRLAHKVGGISIRGMVGLAAGWTKDGRALRALSALVDFIVVGTVLPRPWSGHNQPRVWRIFCLFIWPWRWLILNKMGFPSEGKVEVAKRLRWYASTFGEALVTIGVSIGAMPTTEPEKAHEDYIDVYDYLRKMVDDVVAFIELNVSSPNTEWLRGLTTAEYFEAFLGQILTGFDQLDAVAGRTRKLLVIKSSPDMPEADICSLVDVCRKLGIRLIATANTSSSREGLPAKTIAKIQQLIEKQNCGKTGGGLSGWYVRPRARQQARVIRTHDPAMGLLAVGGIHDFATAWEAQLAGNPEAVALLTGFFDHSPFAGREINEGYLAHMTHVGAENLNELRNRLPQYGVFHPPPVCRRASRRFFFHNKMSKARSVFSAFRNPGHSYRSREI